jgi:hypothetical protein
MKRLVVLFLVLLGVVGFAVKESAADICWRLVNFDTDTVKADIKFIDWDPKKLVTAQYGYLICPGGTGDPCTEEPGRVLLTGTLQKGLGGNKEMALSGSTFDLSFNSPFAFHCWFHMNFAPNTLETGTIAGDCIDYPDFGPFEDTFNRVDCSTVP